MRFGASLRRAGQTAQTTKAATSVVPVRSIIVVQGLPSASRISGMSTVNVNPPKVVIRRPLW